MLDLESFTYLNRALESSISPIVILASNRGHTTIRGATDLVSPHGIPPDLLARLLIVPTRPYSPEDIRTIISLRARTEGLSFIQGDNAALDRLAELGNSVSLRYALQLMTPANVLARVGGRKEINEADVRECEGLFIDARRSAAIVKGDGGKGFIS